MKQRLLNLLLLVCCMSLFSSANETGKSCMAKCSYRLEQLQQKEQGAEAIQNAAAVGFDLSPLDKFVLSI